MKTTIARKLWIEFGVFVLILLVIGIVVGASVREMERNLEELAAVDTLVSEAAYEMEINVVGTGLGDLKYLETEDPRYREWVENDADDFERFRAQYASLVETEEGQELGTEIGLLYGEYRTLGERLMDGKDNQDELSSKINGDLEEADAILDEEIQANVDRAGPDGSRKAEQAARMEADLNEVSTWLGSYIQNPREEYREFVFDNVNDFEEELAAFEALDLTQEESDRAEALGELFEGTSSSIEEAITSAKTSPRRKSRRTRGPGWYPGRSSLWWWPVFSPAV